MRDKVIRITSDSRVDCDDTPQLEVQFQQWSRTAGGRWPNPMTSWLGCVGRWPNSDGGVRFAKNLERH